jgi:hypothetical protein
LLVVRRGAAARQQLHAAGGDLDADTVAGFCGQRLQHAVAPFLVEPRHPSDVAEIGARADELGQRILHRDRRQHSRVALRAFEDIDQRFRHDQVAEADVRIGRLRKGAEIEHVR